MPPTLEEVVAQAHQLSREDKLSLANEMLAEVDDADPRIEAIWDTEIQARIDAHEREPLPTVSLEEILAKYRVK